MTKRETQQKEKWANRKDRTKAKRKARIKKKKKKLNKKKSKNKKKAPGFRSGVIPCMHDQHYLPPSVLRTVPQYHNLGCTNAERNDFIVIRRRTRSSGNKGALWTGWWDADGDRHRDGTDSCGIDGATCSHSQGDSRLSTAVDEMLEFSHARKSVVVGGQQEVFGPFHRGHRGHRDPGSVRVCPNCARGLGLTGVNGRGTLNDTQIQTRLL